MSVEFQSQLEAVFAHLRQKGVTQAVASLKSTHRRSTAIVAKCISESDVNEQLFTLRFARKGSVVGMFVIGPQLLDVLQAIDRELDGRTEGAPFDSELFLLDQPIGDDLSIYDPALHVRGSAGRVATALSIVDCVEAVHLPFFVQKVCVTDDFIEHSALTAGGAALSFRATLTSTTASIRTNKGRRVALISQRSSRSLKCAALDIDAATRTLTLMNESPLINVPAHPTALLFTPEATATLLRVIGLATYADAYLAGTTPLAASLGEKVASEAVTLIDDGRLPEGTETRPFDDEGAATCRTTSIAKGRFINCLSNRTTARMLNQRSSGNGSSSGIAHTNLILQSGPTAFDALKEDLDDVILITSLAADAVATGSGMLGHRTTAFQLRRGKVVGLLQPASLAFSLCQFLNAVTCVAFANALKHESAILTTPLPLQAL